MKKVEKTDPIRSLHEIMAIKELLEERPRDLLLFTLGINNGLRISDILQLKVYQLKNLHPGEYIYIKEVKTGKQNIINMNKSVYKAFKKYVKAYRPRDEDYVFKSRQGGNRPITKNRAWQLVNEWAKTLNLEGNYGTHTLRKTFGYVQRKYYGVSYEILCKRFNHSNPATTMLYLGITADEVTEILQNEI